MALVKRVSTKTRPVFVCTAAAIVVVEGSQRIVKITPDVYAFMLNYCRRGFTDVYADLRFVLSAGTHCPGIIIPLRHSRREQPKFWISFELENSPSLLSFPFPPPPQVFESTIFSAKFLPLPFLLSENARRLERWNKMTMVSFFLSFFVAYCTLYRSIVACGIFWYFYIYFDMFGRSI